MIEIKDSEMRLTAVADSNGKLLVSKGTMETDSTNGICNSFFCWSSPRNWPINGFSLCNDASFVTGLVGHLNVVSTFIVEVNNISLKIKKIYSNSCFYLMKRFWYAPGATQTSFSVIPTTQSISTVAPWINVSAQAEK